MIDENIINKIDIYCPTCGSSKYTQCLGLYSYACSKCDNTFSIRKYKLKEIDTL